MDLTSALLRGGARRPHVLLVPALGGTASRLAVEVILARRGWPSATGPADADLLVVAGSPGPDLGAVIDRTWSLIPSPRARVEVMEAGDAEPALDVGAAELSVREHHEFESPHDSDHHSTSGEHGDGGMEMPGGLPMADLGKDRDGLTLDRLHVRLGPLLPDWPVGLVLRVVLQGDVVQEVESEVLDQAPHIAGSGAFWGGAERRAACELDALARLLGVAGWADAAHRSRRLRDALLAGDPPERVVRSSAHLVTRIRRSRTLRWLVRGIPAGATDLTSLLEGRLDAAEAALRPGGAPGTPVRGQVADLAGMLVGAELAAARLIVAAVDPDTEATPVREQAQHG